MHNPLSFSGLGQWFGQAFTKPATIKPLEEAVCIKSGNEINCDLVHAFSVGSEPAFRNIYDHYAPAIYRVSFRYLRSRQLAEDLVSEVFTTLWQRRAKFSEPEEIRLFLFTASKGRR